MQHHVAWGAAECGRSIGDRLTGIENVQRSTTLKVWKLTRMGWEANGAGTDRPGDMIFETARVQATPA